MFQPILQLDQRITLWLNGSDSLYWDAFAMAATSTAVWLPLAVLMGWMLLRRFGPGGAVVALLFIGLSILLADQMASGVCKPLVERLRPTRNPLLMDVVRTVDGYRGGRYGFFSSHAANTFAVATFVTLLVRYTRLTVVLYLWAALNCWTRVYLGVHYVGDLLVGILWGSLAGWFSFFLWRKTRRRSEKALPSSDLTLTGFSTDDADVLYAGFGLTFLYLFFRALFV